MDTLVHSTSNINPFEIDEEMNLNCFPTIDSFHCRMSIALMIFVNSGGGHYWWIEHATWNGLHLADLVFPSFLWIMGVCLPLSLRSQLQRLATRRALIWRISKVGRRMFLRIMFPFSIQKIFHNISFFLP